MLDTVLIETAKPTKNITSQATLVSYSVPCPQISSGDFLKQMVGLPRIYWENNLLPVCFAGSGIAAALTASGPDRFQAIQQQANQLFKRVVLLTRSTPAEVGPRLFGGFAFAPRPYPGLWTAFPQAMFILPRYQLTSLGGQSWLTINRQARMTDDPTGITQQTRQEASQICAALLATHQKYQSPPLPQGSRQITNLIGQATWEEMVATATQRIRRGDLDKVVLARARQIYSSQPADPAVILARLGERYPSCYRFLFEPTPGHTFLGATPELLAEVVGSMVYTGAMAGSIRRGRSSEEDTALGQQLLANPKERHEHTLVVEAIQECLKPLVTDLYIRPEPELCRLSNIQHLKTVIEGRLIGDNGILPVIEALHPTPAVGGRPRKIALDMIAAMEPTPRGWYASPIGWLDHQGNGLFAVAIRSAVSVGRESLLFAGAGIVADSIPQNEWFETELKFKPLFEAINGQNGE